MRYILSFLYQNSIAMKSFVICASCALLLGAAATGCGEKSATRSSDNVEITEFAVNEVIMTADKNYRVTLDGDTVYFDQYVSLLWPKSLGGADLSVLRDSLMLYSFGDTVSRNPEDAIRRFVTDTSALTGDTVGSQLKYVIEPIDSLPAGIDAMGCYFNNVTANVMEMNEEMVTYQVTASSYFGGAHPMTVIRPFTYEFETARVLDLDNMFTPEGQKEIMPVIVNALARQLDVPVSGLDRAGIFSSQLTFPGMPYINNNILYFHYNPYDIAPYASGMIDVAVYPYEVEHLLRPEVRKLFDLGY